MSASSAAACAGLTCLPLLPFPSPRSTQETVERDPVACAPLPYLLDRPLPMRVSVDGDGSKGETTPDDTPADRDAGDVAYM